MRKSLVSFQRGLNSVNHLPFEHRPRNAQSFPTWALNSLETRSSNIFARKCTHTRRISTDTNIQHSLAKCGPETEKRTQIFWNIFIGKYSGSSRHILRVRMCTKSLETWEWCILNLITRRSPFFPSFRSDRFRRFDDKHG